SGPSLIGGVNAGPPVSDAGTVTLSIGSFGVSTCYGLRASCAPVAGCPSGDSTAVQLACALGQGLSAPSSPVTATVSGSAISMLAKAPGGAGNVAVNLVSSPVQPGLFPGGSFSNSAGSGSATLSGGSDPTPPSLDAPYVTLYQYDTLDNLLCVEQHGGV